MSDKEWSPANVLDVFGDPIARATPVLAHKQPVAVKDIVEQLDVSDPTIYRWIDSLGESRPGVAVGTPMSTIVITVDPTEVCRYVGVAVFADLPPTRSDNSFSTTATSRESHRPQLTVGRRRRV